MSDKILQVIDPNGDIKEQLQAIRDNFFTLQKDSLKGAAQVLAFVPLASDQVLTSTSFASIGMKTSITTSGGLIFIVAGVRDAGNFPHTTEARVTLDGEVKGHIYISPYNSGGITWAGTVGAGVHVIDLELLTNSGAPTISGGLNNLTYLFAVEFII